MAVSAAVTSAPLRYAIAHRERFLSELIEFLRFPSVSAQPRHRSQVAGCATWLARHLQGIGLEKTAVVPTRGHPIVRAEWMGAGAAPTVLLYGHYDVQPVEPLGGWRIPPFQPAVRDGYLYGRGASDDKGQLFVHLKAMECYLRTAGRLPVNVRCLFEGEEEMGSPHLGPFLQTNRRQLRSDVGVISDMAMQGPGRPALVTGLRGSVSLDLEVSGPARELHSGAFGGAVHNPAQALCEIIASLHDRAGRIAIPGFYDRVREESPSYRAALARDGGSGRQLLAYAGAPGAWGEPGYSLYERTTIRPALSVTGIGGGYQGSGTKAVIPSRAAAKINVRLVPGQEAGDAFRRIRDHIRSITPSTVRSRVLLRSLADPVTLDPGTPGVRAAARACRAGFGRSPVLLRSGGSIPVASWFQQVLGVPLVLMGFGLPDDGKHGPNERFSLHSMQGGIATAIAFMAEFPAGSSPIPPASGRRNGNRGIPGGISR